jgi:hypothetical protein
MAKLTRDDIIAGWIRRGELASQGGQSIEIFAVGGAVMAVHFRSRDATADVDAVFEPAKETREWAAIVAGENGWADDWLNDGAKGYLNQKSAGPVLHESPGIRVTSASIPHLLALKLMAWRDDVDFNDAKRLLDELRRDSSVDVSDPMKVLALVEPYILPAHQQKAQYAVEELWELAQ